MPILGRPFWAAQYLVCCIDTYTCDKYVTRQESTTGCAAVHRGTRSDPEKVNLAQVEILF